MLNRSPPSKRPIEIVDRKAREANSRIAQEVTIQISALIQLCIDKGLFTREDWENVQARKTAVVDQLAAKARDSNVI